MKQSEDYYSIRALSNTAMSYLKRSPLHLKAFLDGKTRETKAMKLGRYVHAALLEPEKWRDAIYVKMDGRTVIGKAHNAEMDAKGGWGVSQAEYDMIRGIVGRLIFDPFIKALAMAGFEAEKDLFFQKEGVGCKAKLDITSTPLNMLVDIKTSTDADPNTFIRKAAYLYDYDRQLAWYFDAAVQAGLISENGTAHIVAVEKEPPYAYSVITLTASTLAKGRKKYQALLSKYKEVSENGLFHGYESGLWDEEEETELHELAPGMGAFDAIEMMAVFASLNRPRLEVGQAIGNLRVKALK